MLFCPRCGAERIHQSRRIGLIEKRVLATFLMRPFRCESCDHRFFRWSISANPNSPLSVGERFQRWLRYEEDVHGESHHKA